MFSASRGRLIEKWTTSNRSNTILIQDIGHAQMDLILGLFSASLHLCLGKQNMAIHPRVVLPELELCLDPLGVLPLHIKESSSSSRNKPDEKRSRLLLLAHCLDMNKEKRMQVSRHRYK